MGKCIYTTSVWLHLGVGKLEMFYSNNASRMGCFGDKWTYNTVLFGMLKASVDLMYYTASVYSHRRLSLLKHLQRFEYKLA